MTYEQMEILIKALGVLVCLAITFIIKPIIDSKVSQTEQEKLEAYIKAGVECAEQIFGSGLGQEKKAYVMNYIKDFLGTYIKLELTDKQISDLVESFVWELKHD